MSDLSINKNKIPEPADVNKTSDTEEVGQLNRAEIQTVKQEKLSESQFMDKKPGPKRSSLISAKQSDLNSIHEGLRETTPEHFADKFSEMTGDYPVIRRRTYSEGIEGFIPELQEVEKKQNDRLDIMLSAISLKDPKKGFGKRFEAAKTPLNFTKNISKILHRTLSDVKVVSKENNYFNSGGGILELSKAISTGYKIKNISNDDTTIKQRLAEIKTEVASRNTVPVKNLSLNKEKEYLERILKENKGSKAWGWMDIAKSSGSMFKSASKKIFNSVKKIAGEAISVVSGCYGICKKYARMEKRQNVTKLIENFSRDPLQAILERKNNKLEKLNMMLTQSDTGVDTTALEQKIEKNKAKIAMIQVAIENMSNYSNNKEELSPETKATFKRYNLSSLSKDLVDKFRGDQMKEDVKKLADYSGYTGSIIKGSAALLTLVVSSPILPIIGAVGTGMAIGAGVYNLGKKCWDWNSNRLNKKKLKKELSELTDLNMVSKLQTKFVQSSKTHARNLIIETLNKPAINKDDKKKLERFLKIALDINPASLIKKQIEGPYIEKIRNIEIARLDNKLKTYY